MGCCRQNKVDADGPMSLAQRSGVLLFALLQNSLMGGIVYGWSSIDSTLLIAPESHGGAGIDPEKTSHVFSWAASTAMVSSFFLGIVLDLFGPRMCSLLSLSTIATGCALLAVSYDFAQFSVGFCVLAFGGPGICSSIIHIANLFPESKNLVMGCLSGCIAVSFSVLSVFDYLWHQYEWATFHSLFAFYAIIATLLGVGALVIYPNDPYEESTLDDDSSINGSDDDYKTGQLEGEETRLLVKTIVHPSVHHSPTTVVLRHVASLSAIPEHKHHHESHIQSVAAGPSLMIQQPLDSYLRPYTRSESFMISKEVMATDDPNKDVIMSLKDQPFLKQLLSGSYIRSSILFWICSFVTNFYVSSLSTELADLDQYTSPVQHGLTQTFTLFMSGGVFGSVMVGILIDNFGVEICTSILLVFGQLQMVIVLFFDQYQSMMMLSFFLYTLFRAFLYPVFIASLTSRLGFKYFGVLLGIGFAVSGLFQLLMAPLHDIVAGDCHLLASPDPSGEDDCFEGLWISLHLLQLSALLGLMVVPFLDYRSKVAHELAVEEYKARTHFGYRSLSGIGLSLED
ncbi:major facilitator superfamily transporter [Nitzschia inconspicua]|uniref:Major facilitator superfamily transporter n=1 Tax=Nitzschia inconspicua TaxID=303405 RepID=A0A9K3L7G6_9STRA|nr:major facilitator superfamily transporter [Nitzschia inconspicua]